MKSVERDNVHPLVEGPTPDAGVVLSDGFVALRPWRANDAAAVCEACQDPQIARHTYVPQPYTLADAEGFIAACTAAGAGAAACTAAGAGACTAARLNGSSAAGFAIVDPVTDQVLGSMSRPALDGHRASFGYWLAPAARGRGVATRALCLIADWTLATTDAIRLELYTDLDNPASGRVAERAGFTREGIRRAWDIGRDGQPIDVIFYVRVRETA